MLVILDINSGYWETGDNSCIDRDRYLGNKKWLGRVDRDGG
jgi:hypothetical protein